MKKVCISILFSAFTSLFAYTQTCKHPQYLDIALGHVHSLALKDDGTLLAWGNNQYGQLGDGSTIDKNLPVQVISNNWQKIFAGSFHTIGIKRDSTLWAWGRNNYGQLGVGTTIDDSVPVQVGKSTNWLKVAVGECHTLALKSDSTLWAWGMNDMGQLGIGNNTKQLTPIQIGTEASWVDISAGNYHSLAIKKDGSLWAWGSSEYGQLGAGFQNQISPKKVGADNNWLSVSAGYGHTLGLKTDGTLWAWGLNNGGQLGIGNYAIQPTPTKMGVENTWRNIDAGYSSSFAIKNDGTAWAWGHNYWGQLGLGYNTNENIAVQIQALTEIVGLYAGSYHTAALVSGRDKICMTGDNYHGELGDGTNNSSNTFVCGKFVQNRSVAINWLGTVDSSWHNPLNWSCGIVPNENTEVVIAAGTPFNCTIDIPAVCASLTLSSGAILIANNNLFITAH